jgi:hypothetical protein
MLIRFNYIQKLIKDENKFFSFCSLEHMFLDGQFIATNLAYSVGTKGKRCN